MTEHSIGKIFDQEGNLLGGTILLSTDEVVELETTGTLTIQNQ